MGRAVSFFARALTLAVSGESGRPAVASPPPVPGCSAYLNFPRNPCTRHPAKNSLIQLFFQFSRRAFACLCHWESWYSPFGPDPSHEQDLPGERWRSRSLCKRGLPATRWWPSRQMTRRHNDIHYIRKSLKLIEALCSIDGCNFNSKGKTPSEIK